MTDKVLLPSAWDNLNDEDKELAKELTQSILRGEASLQLLLQLLIGENVDNTIVNDISNHTFDFEVATPNNEQIANTDLMLAAFIAPRIRISELVYKALKRHCDDICRQPGQAEKCEKCRLRL
ncbi:MAG: hypothetical protein ACKPGB_19550, partial [Dolichospermum sp.]